MKTTQKLTKTEKQRIPKTDRQKIEKQMSKESVVLRIYVSKKLKPIEIEKMLQSYINMVKTYGIQHGDSDYHLASLHAN